MVDLLISTYKGIKLKGRFYPTSKLITLTEDISFIVRFSLKLASYQEIRNYLLKKINNEDILIPNEDQIHGFIRGILCLGLTKVAERSGNDLSGYFNKFISNFRVGDFDIKLLKYHPIILGLFNKTISMKKNLQRLRFMDEFDLIDSMSHMRIDTPDKIVAQFRNTSKEVLHIDKL